MNKSIEMAEQYLIHTYNRYPIVFEKGDGVYLYDADGKKYLDFTSGIAVFALGYNNKEYNEAIKNQVDKLIHTSNYFYSEPMAKAAKAVVEHSGMSRVFFTNSGTEAIEGAIKVARKYYYLKTGNADGEIIAMNHSFHGRSMGSLAVTGQPKYQEAFGPMIGNIKFADINDLESVKEQLTEKTCGILLETVQGEGGVYPATKEFLSELRKICDEKDILLMLDEIQCGMGRTGTMFAYQGYDIQPDVVASAKALGCGIPVGAFIVNEKASKVLVPGDHGTTYGGNPLATTAINAVFEQFDKRNVLQNVVEVGSYLEEQLEQLVAKFDIVKERRGKGLMQGIECCIPVADIIKKAHAKGVILINAGTNIIRFVPPLIIEKKHVDEMIGILTEVLKTEA